MTNITEIIPDNMPAWMRDAMNEGQLFNRMIDVGEERDGLRSALNEIIDMLNYNCVGNCELAKKEAQKALKGDES